MALENISKYRYLDPDWSSYPPPDVRFWFKEEESGLVKEVRAHKQILSFASDVFNREFFGSIKSEDDIEIKDVTQEVFQAMMEAIYNKKPDWNSYDLPFLCSLYYLAEKYNIEHLRGEILASIPQHDVTRDNVMRVAVLAEKYCLHPPLYEALYDSAVRFLVTGQRFKDRFKRALELFTETNADHSHVIFRIVERIKNSEKIEKNEIDQICENCKQVKCLNGEGLTLKNFSPGAKVICCPPNPLSGVRVLVTVKDETHFIGRNEDGTVSEWTIRDDYYVFKCS